MSDTIAAIATAPGEGGIAIVRISGPACEKLLQCIFRPASHLPLQDHLLTYGHILDGDQVVDECMAVIMKSPRSYTREDVAEFQVHGGYTSASRVLDLCLRSGARLAEPGEFTRRAFLNGRLDLSQAEAVMALISARGEQARRAAVHQLEGGASAFIRQVSDQLYDIQAGIAACLDYPEEISEEEAASDLGPKIHALSETLLSACDERAARLLQQGLTVALCGRPNVGKSSILNLLLGEEKAIVTSIPGTTRDLVEGELMLSGCRIRLIDTAGIRETDDVVEAEGVHRARQAAERADLVLLVVDSSSPLTKEDREMLLSLKDLPLAIVLNKQDLPSGGTEEQLRSLLPDLPLIPVCALKQDGCRTLKDYILEKARVSDLLSLTQPRHMDAARRAALALQDAEETLLHDALDLCTLDLDRAQAALSEITGDNVEESLLDRVFSTFCVGK